MWGFAGSSGNRHRLGLYGRIWGGFRRPAADESYSRIKNRRQVWRSVRSLLPAVRAVTGVFGAFQSGVKIERVISLLRSSPPRAYSRKKKVGGMPWKQCYCGQKDIFHSAERQSGRCLFCRRTPSKIASQKVEKQPILSSRK